ncbi:MAG: 3-methyl-2-oxobutanoate hydroxymethyltransferase [Chloroflexota bacterium]|nr:3-methyl-2-oxobutanoate hydroxymethyltransferase [Chloroflexota bacterium]
MKARGERIAIVTAYDAPCARLADRAGIDVILVGDSIGNNVLGHADTLSVTMDEMVNHTRAVAHSVRRAFVVGDMPFMSYQPSTRDAVLNAGRLMSEGRADAVKLEGGARSRDAVVAIVAAGIPVMGHIGLTPQSASALGGLRVQGRRAEAAQRLFEDALALEAAGVFALVLEAVPSEIAQVITARLDVPTIGIGAGPHCTGQVLVMHDLFGLSEHLPRFAKQYADLGAEMLRGFASYCSEVKDGRFPSEEHSYHMKADEAERLDSLLSTYGA